MRIYGPELARIHHEHFGHVAAAAADELLARLAASGLRTGTVVDLGAGSGILSRRALDAGYAVVAVERSPDMLGLAREQAPAARFVAGSVWEVALSPCVAAAAVGEVFNYGPPDARPDPARLAARLAELGAALAPGGLLLLDVAGPGRSGPTGARHAVWELAGVRVRLEETEDPARGRLRRRIETVVSAPAGAPDRRSEETHTLALYPPEEVAAALSAAGLEVERLPGYGAFRFPPGWTGFAATKPRG